MYKIKEVSALTNIPISTLRYYEELGLITPSRTDNNYREYSEKDLAWIEFIKRIKETGMRLKDIQTYSELRDQGHETLSERTRMLDKQELLLKEQLKQIQQDIAFIQNKKKIYQKMTDQYTHRNG